MSEILYVLQVCKEQGELLDHENSQGEKFELFINVQVIPSFPKVATSAEFNVTRRHEKFQVSVSCNHNPGRHDVCKVPSSICELFS